MNWEASCPNNKWWKYSDGSTGRGRLSVSCHHTEILLFCSPAGRPPDTLPAHPAASPCPTLLLAALPVPRYTATTLRHATPCWLTLPDATPCLHLSFTLHPCPVYSILSQDTYSVRDDCIIPFTTHSNRYLAPSVSITDAKKELYFYHTWNSLI